MIKACAHEPDEEAHNYGYCIYCGTLCRSDYYNPPDECGCWRKRGETIHWPTCQMVGAEVDRIDLNTRRGIAQALELSAFRTAVKRGLFDGADPADMETMTRVIEKVCDPIYDGQRSESEEKK